VINSVAELGTLLQDVPLEQVQLFLEPGSAYLSIAGALFSVVHERKVDVAAWKAFWGADPLGTLAGKGRLSSSLEQAHADLVDLVGWTLGDFPQVRSVVVSTQAYHQAGCHVVQELAYAMATGVHYLRELTQGGISLEKACFQMYFEFQVGSDLFLEIAKLRAARWLCSKVVAACGGGEDVMAAQQAALSKCRNESEIKELLQPLLDFTSQSSAPGWHTRLIKIAYEAGGSCLAVPAWQCLTKCVSDNRNKRS
jgi:methylmalonyl-CoA mutase